MLGAKAGLVVGLMGRFREPERNLFPEDAVERKEEVEPERDKLTGVVEAD